MALKATIFKATLQLADMDRGLYVDHAVTLARHPSETDERMMVRLLAYALHAPADTRDGALEFAKGLWDSDEPELWQKDLTGQIVHWIDIGQPDERRLLRASGRAARVTVLCTVGDRTLSEARSALFAKADATYAEALDREPNNGYVHASMATAWPTPWLDPAQRCCCCTG